MNSAQQTPLKDILLTRRGVAFVVSNDGTSSQEHVRALGLELADIGYVLSSRLSERLGAASLEELTAFRSWALETLLRHAGGDQKHEPLFRHFPHQIPNDTHELWLKKVLAHYMQVEGQACVYCKSIGTTHVLNPCQDVVCNRCFDGSSYSACPVCEHAVDRTSPFFLPAPDRALPVEKVVFKILDLGDSLIDDAKALFVTLCERKQAPSPADKDALLCILQSYQEQVLSWLPQSIPVRENVALVFGTLFLACDASLVLPHAKRFMTTATDVLRFIVVLSGTDGSLLRETVYKPLSKHVSTGEYVGNVPVRVFRFKVAKLSRALRRALLGLLEDMDPDRLIEDMLRHRSYWVWVGEFLHPHEYAHRFPRVVRAFQVVRKNAPDGTLPPRFQSWNAKVAQTLREEDLETTLSVLMQRPGEFARRLDLTLRLRDETEHERILDAFKSQIQNLSTPVLLTLRNHLPTRHKKAGVRVFWPKSRVAKGVSSPDERSALPSKTIDSATLAINAELLRRFSSKTAFHDGLIDETLKTIIVPFNERTASRSAISLPRGSSVPVPSSKLIRLFLHWCQPQTGTQTDLDLSVAFYDESWRYVDVCSYYQLQARSNQGNWFAKSAGDLRNAPWPQGATEFVDIHCDQARADGIRYAVMVVNNYRGMPFSLLERGFAGLMLRDSDDGKHFDPRTVELKFAIDGENGVFLPLVLDLNDNTLHWLDVHAKGQLQRNNVENSNAAISKICPELIMYFGSGVRASMLDLARLHAAARCKRVFVRGEGVSEFIRRPDEAVEAFHARLVQGKSDAHSAELPLNDDSPVMAMLYRGDMDLPEGSIAYALFRERVTPSLAASDLLS